MGPAVISPRGDVIPAVTRRYLLFVSCFPVYLIDIDVLVDHGLNRLGDLIEVSSRSPGEEVEVSQGCSAEPQRSGLARTRRATFQSGPIRCSKSCLAGSSRSAQTTGHSGLAVRTARCRHDRGRPASSAKRFAVKNDLSQGHDFSSRAQTPTLALGPLSPLTTNTTSPSSRDSVGAKSMSSSGSGDSGCPPMPAQVEAKS